MAKKLCYTVCMNHERRSFARTKHSLPITLLDSEVKSKNISPEGVYFEVITKDIENYSPGKVILCEVEYNNSRFEIPKKTGRFIGFGEVVRVDAIDINNPNKKLGVALKFSEKLKGGFVS